MSENEGVSDVEGNVVVVTSSQSSSSSANEQLITQTPLSLHKNQYNLDLPEGSGLLGTYRIRQDDPAFEFEQSLPMGSRSVPPCRIGNFATDFERSDTFRRSSLRSPMHRGRGRLSSVDYGQRSGRGSSVTTDEEEKWKDLSENEENSAMIAATESLHAVLDRCYTEPDPKDRDKRVQAFRDKYPGVYHDFMGDDVTGQSKDKAAGTVQRHRSCNLQ